MNELVRTLASSSGSNGDEGVRILKQQAFISGSPKFVANDLQSTLNRLDFILRARVLKLYRQALRTARRAPEGARAELNQTIRQEMENNRDCKDKQKIRFLISEGLERLKGLDEMLDMQGRKE